MSQSPISPVETPMIRLPNWKELLADDSLWRIGGIAIAIGIGVGCVIMLAIVLFRRHQFWHGMGTAEELVGTTGVVEVAFNESNHGKVRLQIAHRTIACMAYSDESHQFEKGDPIIVVGMQGGKLWVIPATE